MTTDRVVNNQKITDMLQKMLQLGNTFTVDINRAVHYIDTEEPIMLGEGKVKKKLYIYDTNIQDPTATILNPLNETSVTTPDQLLFYSALNSTVSQWLARIVQFVIDECVRLKDDKNAAVDPNVVKILTPFISKVDEKLSAEFEKIRGAGYKDFCNIYYNRTKKCSTLLMGIEDETGDYQKLFPNGHIRKKSWSILNDIIRFILKVPDDKKIKEEYFHSTEKVDCPKFTTFSHVWIKVWECIDPYLGFYGKVDSDPETITALKEHFKNIPIYKECVSWLKQPTSFNMKSVTAPNSNPNSNIITVNTPEVKEPSWKLTSNNSNIIHVTTPSTKQPSWAITSNSYAGNSGYGGFSGGIINVTTRRW